MCKLPKAMSGLRGFSVPVCATSAVKQRGAFQPRCGRSGVAFAATNDHSAGANCKRHDAAPVLFGRAASAAGAVRRLDCLNAKLGRDTNRNYEVAELLRQPLFSACNNDDSTSFDTTNCVTYLIKRLLKARKPGISRRENDYANVEPCDILLEPQTFVCREEHVKGVRTKLQQLAVLDG